MGETSLKESIGKVSWWKVGLRKLALSALFFLSPPGQLKFYILPAVETEDCASPQEIHALLWEDFTGPFP